MSKRIFIFLILSILLIGCNKEDVHIGFAGSLTGSGHEISIAAKNGFQMAIDEANADGGIKGRKISPIIKDDQSTPDKGLQIVDEFIAEEVDIVVGFITSNMTEAVKKGLTHNMMFLSPSISTPLLSEKDDFFIRTVSPMEFEARELAKQIVKQGVKKLAIVYDMSNDVYAKRYYEFVSEEFLLHDAEIVYIKAMYDPEYDNIVEKIVNSDAEGLCLVTSANNAAEILQRLELRVSDYPIALSQWTMASELIRKGGKSVEGAFGLSTYNTDIASDSYLAYEKTYYERYNDTPSFISITSYETTKVLIEALRQNTSKKDIKNYLINKTYQGLQGQFEINEYGDGLRQFYVVEIRDGSIVPKE